MSSRSNLRQIVIVGIVACLGLVTAKARADMNVIAQAAGIGLTPEAIVIADLQANASGLLVRLNAASETRNALAIARAQAEAIGATVSELAEDLLAEDDDTEVAAQYRTALAELEQVELQIQSLRGQLFEHVVDGQTQQVVNRLLAWRNAATFRVPAEFRVLDRTPAQWKQIEKALRAEKRALRLEEDLDPGYAELLNDIRSNPAVTAAAQRLDTHLATVQQVFESYEFGG